MHRAPSTGGLAVIVAIAAACATEPKPNPIGLFGLETIAGQPLPQLAWETDQMRARLVADTMEFKADGTGTETSWLRFESKGPTLEEPGQTEIVAFTYTITGNTIAISFECPGLASCAPPPHYVGTIEAYRISLAPQISTGGMRVFQKKPIEG